MKELTYSKNTLLRYFIAGFLTCDAIGHGLRLINQSELSVHGIQIGVTGNWIVLLIEIIAITVLIRKNK